MDNFESLMLAIYEETIDKDKLFVGHDVLVARLGIDKQTFGRLRSTLARKSYANDEVVGMDRLTGSGVEYVENHLR